ncbi:MAG: S9 family peptidase, partial [Acidimicrobiia bacterium]
MSTTAPYGSWQSPVGAADTVAGIVRFSDLQYDDGSLYWLESRPSEGGRTALVRRTDDGTIGDVLPDTVNLRTMAHEYGGGAYRADSGDLVYSEFTDQRLYRVTPDGSTTPLTSEPPRPRSVRFADSVRLFDGSLIAVRESHPAEGEAVNELVLIRTDGTVDVIASGSDFYSTPRLSPDNTRLAWIEWDHPNMPWDGTRLVVADVESTAACTVVAGGDDESIVQPEWAPDGTLVFASDRTGWWNLYRYDGLETMPILEME